MTEFFLVDENWILSETHNGVLRGGDLATLETTLYVMLVFLIIFILLEKFCGAISACFGYTWITTE